MTLEEAKEAGLMVEALANADDALAALDGDGEAADQVGISFSVDHSDSGNSGLGPYVIIPPTMARDAMAFLREMIRARLSKLGVSVAGPTEDAA